MSSGNDRATGKKAKHGPELVQRIRGAVLSAFDAVEKEGKLLSQILAEKLKEDPMRFIDMVSKYCPREVAMDLEANVTHHTEELSEAELERIAAGRSTGVAEKAPKPQKPAPVH